MEFIAQVMEDFYPVLEGLVDDIFKFAEFRGAEVVLTKSGKLDLDNLEPGRVFTTRERLVEHLLKNQLTLTYEYDPIHVRSNVWVAKSTI